MSDLSDLEFNNGYVWVSCFILHIYCKYSALSCCNRLVMSNERVYGSSCFVYILQRIHFVMVTCRSKLTHISCMQYVPVGCNSYQMQKALLFFMNMYIILRLLRIWNLFTVITDE